LFSILIVSLVIPLAYAVTSRVFGEDVPALMATVLIASMPAFLISVSRVANDCLAIVLFAVLTYALLRSEPWDAVGSLLIGVTLGAGLLTKAYFVAAFPAILWAAIAGLLKSPRGERARTFMKISAAMALAFLIAGWWYLRTLGGHGPSGLMQRL
jgi:4-amino-4-deoxy-L-arabinose transferase-like glycosyltransferase